MLFQLNRNLVSFAGMENSFKKTFLPEGKLLPLTGMSEKLKKMVAKGRVLNRLLYNLNNGFH